MIHLAKPPATAQGLSDRTASWKLCGLSALCFPRHAVLPVQPHHPAEHAGLRGRPGQTAQDTLG